MMCILFLFIVSFNRLSINLPQYCVEIEKFCRGRSLLHDYQLDYTLTQVEIDVRYPILIPLYIYMVSWHIDHF